MRAREIIARYYDGMLDADDELAAAAAAAADQQNNGEHAACNPLHTRYESAGVGIQGYSAR